MTLKITVSVDKNNTHSAVVTCVDKDYEPVAYAETQVVEPGEAKDFYVYSNHNILIGEIPFDETENQPPSAGAYFVHHDFQQPHVQ